MGTDCPSEACCWEHLLGDGGVDEASRGGSRRGDGESKTTLFGEVGGQKGNGGTEDEAIANTDADPLGKEKVPVFGGEGGHEHAEELEDGANGIREFEEAVVGGSAGEGADKEEEEDLDGANPANGRRRFVKIIDVKCLYSNQYFNVNMYRFIGC